MKLINLKLACRDHENFIITDSELVSIAYSTSIVFPNWSIWFGEAHSALTAFDFKKLTGAAVSLRAEFVEGQTGFKIGYISPTKSAADSLRDAIEVPCEFVVFLAEKTNARNQP